MIKLYVAGIAPLEQEELFQRGYAGLPLHRKEKIDRLRFHKDRQRSLGAWLLLEAALKERGLGGGETLRLTYGDGGKPYLEGHPELFFNLSHSGERVLCALSDGEVGCDVEQLRPVSPKLAKRFFSREEAAALAQCPTEALRQHLFFRLWTLKESFIKMVGLGLQLPLGEFSMDLSGGEISVKQQRFPECSFHFQEFNPGDGYAIACCTQCKENSPLQWVDLAQVICKQL